ncbi:hypothetical protein [Sphingobacterium wenxiniae]|uniref:Uncharacterized protein n=1 Tax=Sphingobacterium wenxiniae TaxID=683125 RepID=A0A1I6TGZ5_9SPHI|nr:hypothetical protein [Sphingobacterium wenxiniae]SFS88474.1 hypothetical protein SAMN05660206_106145 [Sphingobacterium wenxiniae]
MIPQKIQALFEFIDFLDKNKEHYIQKYIPLCNELTELDKQRSSLKPNKNYKDKLSYDFIQEEIKEKFIPITENIYKPITSKLQELGIWAGDEIYTSIWNNNISEISDFKRNFSEADIKQIFHYKQKYLNFRTETNSDFLCLSFVFSNLDEILKELFDFFKDTDENEFESFEPEIIECKSIEEALHLYTNSPKRNFRFTLPSSFLTSNASPTQKEVETSRMLEELSVLKGEVKQLLNSSTSKEIHSSYEEAIYRVRILKSVIEDKGGFSVFKIQENQNEAMLQQLFKFVKEGSAWDINVEVNNGRGAVDFTVSNGSKDKTVIEFKLAKSSSLKRNLQHQVEVYKKANDTNKAVIAILYFNQTEYLNLTKILRELNLDDLENIILIDGAQKLSASNVKN